MKSIAAGPLSPELPVMDCKQNSVPQRTPCRGAKRTGDERHPSQRERAFGRRFIWYVLHPPLGVIAHFSAQRCTVKQTRTSFGGDQDLIRRVRSLVRCPPPPPYVCTLLIMAQVPVKPPNILLLVKYTDWDDAAESRFKVGSYIHVTK